MKHRVSELSKIPCSVGIIVFNREASLRATLESVRDFAEVIICDGGSTDKTLDIAREYGCVIIEQDRKYKNPDNTIADFSGVRNQTLEESSNEWFLFVDSDEYLSQEVVDEIRSIVVNNKPEYYIYNMPRKFIVDGIKIDCAVTYPSYQTRFFNKRAVTNFFKNVHERIQERDGYAKGNLEHCTWVPTDSYEEKKRKASYYIGIEVERNKNIKIATWLKMSFRSCVSIIYSLIRYLLLYVRCKGMIMPFSSEVLRHKYQLRLIYALGKQAIIKK